MSQWPICPACGEDELYRLIGPDVRVKCAECGYDSGPIEARDGLSKAELVAATVRLYADARARAPSGGL